MKPAFTRLGTGLILALVVDGSVIAGPFEDGKAADARGDYATAMRLIRPLADVVEIFEDAGISGAKGRDQRPGLDAMLKAVARREFEMVAAWSVDRLGRSLIDLLKLLVDLHAKGVDLFLHQQGLDTSTPSGRAMFQMLGTFAEFERAMIRERVQAGLSRAREQGKRFGRPRLEETDAKKVAAIRAARRGGKGVRRIARDLGVGVGTVLRVTDGVAAS